MYRQETNPGEGDSLEKNYSEALNQFWATVGPSTRSQLALARAAMNYAGRLDIPKPESVIPEVARNLVSAKEFTEWLAVNEGLSAHVTVDGLPMPVKKYGFDHEERCYVALATPTPNPQPILQVPLNELYPLDVR